MAKVGKRRAQPKPPPGLSEWTMAAWAAAGRTPPVSSAQRKELGMRKFSEIQSVDLPERPTISDWVGPLAADTETDPDVLHVYLPDHRLLEAMDPKRADKFLLDACRELHRRYPERVFVCFLWIPCDVAWPRTTQFLSKIKSKISMPQEVARWWERTITPHTN